MTNTEFDTRDTGWYYPESIGILPLLPDPADEMEFDVDKLIEAVDRGYAKEKLLASGALKKTVATPA